MTRLAIIADDLTGALGSAAPFAMRGERTMVAVTPNALKEVLATGASVIGVSTNSREFSPEAARARVCEAIADLAGRRVMCVIGSTDPITMAQLVRLRETDPTVAYVPAPSGIAPPDLPPQARVTILQAVPGASPIDAFEVSQQLATSLSRFQPDSDTLLVISGGATAQVVLEQLGLVSLQIVGEALSGLPIARAGGFTLVTKSGGFGVPDTLVQLLSRDVSITGKSVGS